MRLRAMKKQSQNKPNFRKAKMNVNSLTTKDYRKKDDFAVPKNKPKTKPISERPKISAKVFATKDYENETALRPQKNKPKQSQFQTGHQPPPTSYLPPRFSLKFTLQNAPNFQKTFNMHRFLIDNSIVLRNMYREAHLSVSYGEGIKCKLATLFLQWYFGVVSTHYLLSRSVNS